MLSVNESRHAVVIYGHNALSAATTLGRHLGPSFCRHSISAAVTEGRQGAVIWGRHWAVIEGRHAVVEAIEERGR